MKNLVMTLVFMLTLTFAFASTELVKEHDLSTSVTEMTAKMKEPVRNTDDELACCTVSSGDYSVTVCRTDGNINKACRQAIRVLKRLQ